MPSCCYISLVLWPMFQFSIIYTMSSLPRPISVSYTDNNILSWNLFVLLIAAISFYESQHKINRSFVLSLYLLLLLLLLVVCTICMINSRFLYIECVVLISMFNALLRFARRLSCRAFICKSNREIIPFIYDYIV